MDGRGEMSVEEIAAISAMTTNDVLHTLQNLNMLRYSVSPARAFWQPADDPIEGNLCDRADGRHRGAEGEAEREGEGQGKTENRWRVATVEATGVYGVDQDLELVRAFLSVGVVCMRARCLVTTTHQRSADGSEGSSR